MTGVFFAIFVVFIFMSCAEVSSKTVHDWSKIEVAMVQYPFVGGLSLEQLTMKVEKYVSTAAQNGTQLIVLPELFSLDLLDLSIPETEQFESIIQMLFPRFILSLESMAATFNIYILAGSVPAMVSGKIRNRSYLVSPDRGSLLYQEKMFLTPDEVEWGWEGVDTLSVIDTPWGKTAITICYDSEFPLVSQALAAHDIDLILIPSMTGASGFSRVRWSAQARSVEHLSYVLVTGTIGDAAEGWEFTGQAAALGPSLDGYSTPPTIAEGTANRDEIVYATLNLAELKQAKKAGQYDPARDERNRTITVDVVTM
jgi:predicted amidohydrolase